MGPIQRDIIFVLHRLITEKSESSQIRTWPISINKRPKDSEFESIANALVSGAVRLSIPRIQITTVFGARTGRTGSIFTGIWAGRSFHVVIIG